MSGTIIKIIIDSLHLYLEINDRRSNKTERLIAPLRDQVESLIDTISEIYSSRRELHITAFESRVSILFLVLVKDRRIRSEYALLLESELAPYQPISHLYWIILELFKSVARLTSRLEMSVHEIINNEQKAWEECFMRDPVLNLLESSKSQYIKSIRRTANLLKENINPFDSESPELKIFIDYALTLSDTRHSDKNQPSDIRTLRKHIRQRLKDLIKALTGYATYLERSSCQVLTDIDGRTWKRGIKNNMKMIQ
jgi:hypothetical protein